MPFKILKKVVSHLRKTSRCPECGSGFPEDMIFVLATSTFMQSGSCSGLFFLACPSCPAQSFVFMEMGDEIRIETKPTSRKITANEVLDMHNFLKEWEGDVKDLFKGLRNP
ncbi:hypothetical protein HYV58_00650 [Candidatus Peregrinibacteria bacterium]|nr:hypothetical protein [Candidatus Peregrinibacteria bacterium]